MSAIAVPISEQVATMRQLADAEWRRRWLPLHVAAAGTIAVAGLVVLLLLAYEPADSHAQVAVGCGLLVLALILYVRYALGVPWISASVGYLALFWMFHYGLAFTAVLVPDLLTEYADWELEWLFSANARMAMVLALLGSAAFVLALSATLCLWPAQPPPQPVSAVPLHLAGWALMLAGLLGTGVSLLLGGGVGVLSLGYLEFREQVLDGTPLQSCVDLSQIGCLMCLCSAPGTRWRRALAVWSPLAVTMLLVGLRTEAMIPLVTFVIALAYRGVHVRRTVVALLIAASVVIIPVVRVVRLVGFENRSEVSWTSVSPLETFTELGSTLHAATAYIDWIEGGDDHLLGASYWAPIDRQIFERVVPGRTRIAAEEDVRIPGRDMGDRTGSVGHSATGEAYYNFGIVGPLIFFGCLGVLFGWIERNARKTAYLTAWAAFAAGVFFFNIRGHFLSVPAALASGAVVITACYLLAPLAASWPLTRAVTALRRA